MVRWIVLATVSIAAYLFGAGIFNPMAYGAELPDAGKITSGFNTADKSKLASAPERFDGMNVTVAGSVERDLESQPYFPTANGKLYIDGCLGSGDWNVEWAKINAVYEDGRLTCLEELDTRDHE